MRIDLFLKQSRLIRRRKIANDACVKGLVSINNQIVKPSTRVVVGDVIKLNLGSRELVVKALRLDGQKSDEMYQMIEENFKNKDRA